tara:strand:+ start:3290 stop:3748 length:459 start_codon:yes stop_codon:yes gene_type:complete
MPKYFSGLGGLNVGDKGQFFWTPMHQQKLEGIITAGFQQLGKAVFVESQARVPVVTGNLKRSGYILLTSTGVEITYTAPYAEDVEQGTQGGSEYVREHVQRRNGKNVKVKGHYKTVAGFKARQFLGGSLQSLVTESLSKNLGFQKYLNTDTI